MTASLVVLLWAAFPVGLVLIWLLFRSGGYKRHPLHAPPGKEWTSTGEQFIDPQSRVLVDVWYCARTGERAYVRASVSELN